MTYRFDWINNGLDITDPTVSWTYAGFDTEGAGLLYVVAKLETPQAVFKIELSKVGTASDRSDAAIDALLTELLAPYVV